jgi:uncharacterized protein (DUF1697 family)
MADHLMPAYVAFLRAINVGGHAVVKMDRLQRAFCEAGCEDVKTVIQSGNVVFRAPGNTPAGLFQRIQENLRLLTGQKVAVMFRKGSEIAEMVRLRPFEGLRQETDSKWYVTFLHSRPTVSLRLPFISEREALEVFRISDREAFVVSWRIPGKAMYGFPNKIIEKELGVFATTRNWSTVMKIAEIMLGGAEAASSKGPNALKRRVDACRTE